MKYLRYLLFFSLFFFSPSVSHAAETTTNFSIFGGSYNGNEQVSEAQNISYALSLGDGNGGVSGSSSSRNSQYQFTAVNGAYFKLDGVNIGSRITIVHRQDWVGISNNLCTVTFSLFFNPGTCDFSGSASWGRSTKTLSVVTVGAATRVSTPAVKTLAGGDVTGGWAYNGGEQIWEADAIAFAMGLAGGNGGYTGWSDRRDSDQTFTATNGVYFTLDGVKIGSTIRIVHGQDVVTIYDPTTNSCFKVDLTYLGLGVFDVCTQSVISTWGRYTKKIGVHIPDIVTSIVEPPYTSAPLPPTSTCGSAAGQPDYYPSMNLCSGGFLQSAPALICDSPDYGDSGDCGGYYYTDNPRWNWGCNTSAYSTDPSGVLSYCSAPYAGCTKPYDAAYGQYVYNTDVPNTNDLGCVGFCNNGAKDYPTCTPIPATCNSEVNGKTFNTKPIDNLCSSGAASPVTTLPICDTSISGYPGSCSAGPIGSTLVCGSETVFNPGNEGGDCSYYDASSAPADCFDSTPGTTCTVNPSVITWTWACAGTSGQALCSAGQAASDCTLPWGGTLASGSSVIAYQAPSVVSPTTCAAVSEMRTCTNGVLSGSYTNQGCLATTPPPSVDGMSATPSLIPYNTTSTLSWSASGTIAACYITGGIYTTGNWYGTYVGGALGSVNTGNLTANTTYTMNCHDGASWAVNPQSVTVTVASAPSVDRMSAVPNPIPYNTTSTLSWSASGTIAACYITGGIYTSVYWYGTYVGGASGALPTGNLTSNTVYTMNCHDGVSWATNPQSVTIVVDPAAIATINTFTINGSTGPVPLIKGDMRNIAWNVSNAVSCTALSNDGWSGDKTSQLPVGSDLNLPAYTTSDHTLDCVNVVGVHTTATVRVNVSCIPDPGTYGACNCSTETKSRTGVSATCTPTNQTIDCDATEKNSCRDFNWKEVTP